MAKAIIFLISFMDFKNCNIKYFAIIKANPPCRWDTPETPEDIPTEEDLSNHPPPADV